MIGLFSLGGGLAVGLIAIFTKERKPLLFGLVAMLMILGLLDGFKLITGAIPLLMVRAILGGLWLAVAYTLPSGSTRLMFYMGAFIIWMKSVLSFMGR